MDLPRKYPHLLFRRHTFAGVKYREKNVARRRRDLALAVPIDRSLPADELARRLRTDRVG